MKKTNRNPPAERRNNRESIGLRSPVQEPLFLKPSFSISAQREGLTVSVSASPAEAPATRA